MTKKSSKTSSVSIQTKKQYEIMVYPEFKKDRASWSDDDNKRINEAITSLRENPRAHGCEKLSGESDNYRLRVGNYRILYSIQDGTVMLVTVKNVADRKDVYKAR